MVTCNRGDQYVVCLTFSYQLNKKFENLKLKSLFHSRIRRRMPESLRMRIQDYERFRQSVWHRNTLINCLTSLSVPICYFNETLSYPSLARENFDLSWIRFVVEVFFTCSHCIKLDHIDSTRNCLLRILIWVLESGASAEFAYLEIYMNPEFEYLGSYFI